MVRNKTRKARERLERDLTAAIEAMAGRLMAQQGDGRFSAGKTLMAEKHLIVASVTESLRRNWQVSERARGQTSTF